MANVYKIAQTHNIASNLLNVITPQPRSGYVMAVARDYSAAPGFYEQGLYVCYHFDFIESSSVYVALLTLFALDNYADKTAPVTCLALDQNFDMQRYNGYAHKPQIGDDVRWENFFIRDLKIYITDLERA